MSENNGKINGVIMIHKELPIGTIVGDSGIWTAHYTIGAENTTTNLMKEFFGELNQLQCIIKITAKEIKITIPKP